MPKDAQMPAKKDQPRKGYASDRGSGDELHQHVPERGSHGAEGHLTTNQGIRVSDNQNQLKSGPRGAVLLEDFVLREKIFHFDHERIPERIVHARGSAAHGFFELYKPLTSLTKADLFQRAGERTPVFVRFSTVAGGAGSVDTPRDVRGFAVKFYTQEGNWDLVGNNIPVFFIQDAMKFPDLVHSVKMEADRGYPQAASAHDTFWDFISLMPESTHMIMWAMSDRTIPRSFATMEGFGVHTFRLINAKGKSTFVKFHWKPKLGLQSTLWDEAVKIAGADPDFQRRDLFERIERGDFPEWELGIQTFDQEFADGYDFDVLDPTKIIPEEVIPVKMIGRMLLDRWPDNFFAETEQAAYCPANIVPGVDFTNDPLLQGRLFSYLDTQKSRLGTGNFHQIPINAPKCPVMNFQRDGMMQMLQPKGRANYEPNSLNEVDEVAGPRECPETGFTAFDEAEREADGGKVRLRAESFADHYSQARMFFRSLHPAEQAHLASALVFELSKVGLAHVCVRMMSNLVNVDPELAQRVADGLAMPLPKASPTAVTPQDLEPSPALRIVEGPRQRKTLEGRCVGILFSDGSDPAEINAVKDAVVAAMGKPVLIAPKVGGAKLKGGKTLPADGQLAGTPSVTVDAIALVLAPPAAEALVKDGAAVQFVMDAFGHLKAIGANEGAQALLDKAGVEKDKGVTGLGEDFIKAAGRRFWDREPKVRMLA
jgi:catalase